MITPNGALKLQQENEEKVRIAQEERAKEKNAEALKLARDAEAEIDKLIVEKFNKETWVAKMKYPVIAQIAGTYAKVAIQHLIYALNEIYQKSWEVFRVEENENTFIVFQAKPEPKAHWDSYCTTCGRHHSAKYQEDLACPYCEGESTCLALPHKPAQPFEEVCDELHEMEECKESPSFFFFYKAYTKEGRIVAGTTECVSKDQLIRRLEAQGFTPLLIETIEEDENEFLL